MKSKGFTLVELLLVIVIITIVTVITVPNIMEALSESKKQGGESVEKLVLKNLELYNSDKEEDLWYLEKEGFDTEGTHTCVKISIEQLYSANPDLNMGDCLFRYDESLYIKKLENGNYKYYANIVCGKNLPDGMDENAKNKIVDHLNGVDKYYETPDFTDELLGCVYPEN